MLFFIYHIKVGDLTYVGHTKNLNDRWIRHKANVNSLNARDAYKKLYVAMRNHGVDNCVFIPIREIDLFSVTEARMEEQAEMNKFAPEQLLNIKNAYSTEADNLAKNRARAKNQTIRKYSTPESAQIEIERMKNRYHKRKAEDPEWVESEKLRKAKCAKEAAERIKNDPVLLQQKRDYQAAWHRQNRLNKKLKLI